MANIKTITITDVTQPQINAAFIALTSATKGLEVDIKAVDSAWKAANKDLQQQIESIRRGTIVYSAGANINISSTGVISATVPTKTSQLQNDSGFITSASIPTKTSDLQNDSGFITSSDVGDGTITIQRNGVDVKSFSMNQSSSDTVNITVPTELSDLTNDLNISDFPNDVGYVEHPTMYTVLSFSYNTTSESLEFVASDGTSFPPPNNTNNLSLNFVTGYSHSDIEVGSVALFQKPVYITINGTRYRMWQNGIGAQTQGGATMQASYDIPAGIYQCSLTSGRCHFRGTWSYFFTGSTAGDQFRFFSMNTGATNGNTYGARPKQAMLRLQHGSTYQPAAGQELAYWYFWYGNAYLLFHPYWNGSRISNTNYNIPAGDYLATFTSDSVFISEKPRTPEYTYVVDSDAALANWVNGTTGYDYTSVLVRKGSWTYTSTNSSTTNIYILDLSNKTEVIVGEPGAVLNLNRTISSGTGSKRLYAIHYGSVNKTSKTRYIRDLTLNCTLTNTTGTSWNALYGLSNCSNVSNCTINCHGIVSTTNAYCNDYAISGCYNVENCYITQSNENHNNTSGSIFAVNSSYLVRLCGCSKTDVDKVATNYIPYNSSYSSPTADGTYACANTLNGGWNT